ncbi:hypothetical protein GCU67_20715 [Modestobacter muralis]|uniref:Ribbon-helix-helix protein, CopG family n=1 Tax=Modestobacter muralis TaxID=1608614 RepID=A0A6P0F5T3_9ACTN|nr:hypothetical protein [Modestobacter muralis]NEK96568.1 hypothetical protein [Modestobacter muralis]NEN53468.1 hypothetical protein [Modestobacter muralis]
MDREEQAAAAEPKPPEDQDDTRAALANQIFTRLGGGMAGPGKRGREHKGDRVLTQSRPHRVIVERVDQEAAAVGMTRSDFIALCLARQLNLEQFAPVVPAQNGQEVLPLGRTA